MDGDAWEFYLKPFLPKVYRHGSKMKKITIRMKLESLNFILMNADVETKAVAKRPFKLSS